jgi:hypothetical protein
MLNANQITIILTSTVNVHNKGILWQKSKEIRIKSYIRPIKKWLYNTNFNIVLIENSGYSFSELNEDLEYYKDRFEIITFIEKEIKEASYLLNEDGKGASEIFAINYAYNNSKLTKNAIFIIKVTARYFMKDLENTIKNIELENYDGLSQHDEDRCEMVGSHINNFHTIFNRYLINQHGNYEQHVENIYKLRLSWFPNIYKCPVFEIEPTERGGVNEIYTDI